MDQTTLSWSTRIKGFAICFVIGILCSFLGSFALFLKKGLTVFAIFYTLGNIISLTRQRLLYIRLEMRILFIFVNIITVCVATKYCQAFLYLYCSALIDYFPCSTCFLMGPVNQIKKMFAATRVIATILVFLSIGITLFAALHVSKTYDIFDHWNNYKIKFSLCFSYIILVWLLYLSLFNLQQ